MTKYCNGHPVLVDILCANRNTVLYTRQDTKVEIGKNGYCLCNTYSGYVCKDPDNVKFHKKIRIYVCDSYGYYVNANGCRCYINSLMTSAQMKEIGFRKLY